MHIYIYAYIPIYCPGKEICGTLAIFKRDQQKTLEDTRLQKRPTVFKRNDGESKKPSRTHEGVNRYIFS